jgi:hypothetical protein
MGLLVARKCVMAETYCGKWLHVPIAGAAIAGATAAPVHCALNQSPR